MRLTETSLKSQARCFAAGFFCFLPPRENLAGGMSDFSRDLHFLVEAAGAAAENKPNRRHGSKFMSLQSWLCRIRSRFVGNLRMSRATQRRQRVQGHRLRGAVCQVACGCENLESSGQFESVDSPSSDSLSVEATPGPISEIDEPRSYDESVPVRLLLETPNIRLFEIGVDEVYGYANYGWAETSEGSWGAGGDAGNHQAGSKSLWITLAASQSASLRTANGWLIVSIDGHETQVCFAHEIEYLHVNGGDNTVDLTGIEKETLSSNLLIDLNGGVGSGTLIGSEDADCLVIGSGNDQIHRGEEHGTSLTWAKFGDDTTTNLAEAIEADGADGWVVNEICNALMCDVAFIDNVNLREDADDETEILATADHAIADDETHAESRQGGSVIRRTRPGMKMNL